MNSRTVILKVKQDLTRNVCTDDTNIYVIPQNLFHNDVDKAIANAARTGKNIKLYIRQSGTAEASCTSEPTDYVNIDVIEHFKLVTNVDTIEVKNDKPKDEVLAFLSTCHELKPQTLKISDIKWKYLMRSVLRGKNILMTGPTGSGKTKAAQCVVNSLSRPDFYFNLGATQDPRSTLIGNTHFNKESGTIFYESLFVKAMQTKDAVILLDEISRAHPEAWNILMTVLDPNQRYLRLDESQNTPTIKVAEGVSFIGTANIGNEYTSTRIMDRALLDRFVIIEMDCLDKESEASLLTMLYPDLDNTIINNISEIASLTRLEVKKDNAKLMTSISTRLNIEVAGLINDGFSLPEAADICIYPFFSNDGGLDAERVFIKQLIQKYTGEKKDEKALFGQNTEAAQ